MIIWNEKNSYETSYGVALYPDAKELRLSSRTLNYEKIRRKQELFKLARIHSMKFKEYLENAVKAVNITDKYCEFWPINDFVSWATKCMIPAKKWRKKCKEN